MKRRVYLGTVSSVALIGGSGCLDGVEVSYDGSDSSEESNEENNEPTEESEESVETEESDDDEEEEENEPEASIGIGDRLPVGFAVWVSVEVGDASAISIEYNDEEVKAINQDGEYDIAGFDDDGVMDVGDVEMGDLFTVYAIYGDSYVEIASEVAA